jgi:hypothetical protein
LKKASEDILTKLENSGKVSKKKTKNKKKKGYNFFN